MSDIKGKCFIFLFPPWNNLSDLAFKYFISQEPPPSHLSPRQCCLPSYSFHSLWSSHESHVLCLCAAWSHHSSVYSREATTRLHAKPCSDTLQMLCLVPCEFCRWSDGAVRNEVSVFWIISCRHDLCVFSWAGTCCRHCETKCTATQNDGLSRWLKYKILLQSRPCPPLPVFYISQKTCHNGTLISDGKPAFYYQDTLHVTVSNLIEKQSGYWTMSSSWFPSKIEDAISKCAP